MHLSTEDMDFIDCRNVWKENFMMKMNRKESQTPILEREKNGVRYLQFPAFMKPEICRHLFSTRIGGVSEGYLGSMNLSYTRGDNPENVDENFRKNCASYAEGGL